MDNLDSQNIEQEDMNEVFSTESEGFTFDKVFYLHVDEKVIGKITDRRFKYRSHMYEKDEIVTGSGMADIWKAVIDNKFPSIQKEIEFVSKEYPNKLDLFESQIWRDMQHYTIDEQLWWWKEKSNAYKVYDDKKFIPQKIEGVKNLRNEKNIAEELMVWLKELKNKYQDANFIINVSLGTSETQVAWFLLAEGGYLPAKTNFIKTYDDKSDGETKRFKKFTITKVSKSIFGDIKTLRVYDNPHSNLRKLAALKMQTYLKQGFAILILGERGTGKSRLVKEVKDKDSKKNIVEVNCASFDDDAKAESELFGYNKGAFTGAIEDKKGLFEEANNGILFFDEVHNLSKMVQGKLMKALQTDPNNKYHFRRMQSTKEIETDFIAIFASNLPIELLKKTLLPDFFDRISQLIIELPALRETPEERAQDWAEVWKYMRFKYDVPRDKHLITWLKTLKLFGNFRDLQKIAIYYKSFLELPDEAKKIIEEESPYEFTRKQFEKYYSKEESKPKNEILEYLFDNNLLNQEEAGEKLTKRYKRLLLEWVRFNYPNLKAKAVLDINSEKTLYNWKNEADTNPPDLDFLV
jgi:transcriptional regulator with AAA-type ATPase domain